MCRAPMMMQSVGVPRTAKWRGPTSRNRNGSFSDNECETPDWSSSGATTQTSSDSTRAISSTTFRPGAWMPSSLVQRIRIRLIASFDRFRAVSVVLSRSRRRGKPRPMANRCAYCEAAAVPVILVFNGHGEGLCRWPLFSRQHRRWFWPGFARVSIQEVSNSTAIIDDERLRLLVLLQLRFLAQHRIQQGSVNLDLSVVIDISLFSEPVHEETHARSRGADHFRQRLLAERNRSRLSDAFQRDVRQPQQQTREAFLAAIEEMVDQVVFHLAVAGQQIGDEKSREARLGIEGGQHGPPCHRGDHAVFHGLAAGVAPFRALDACFAEELPLIQDSDHRFLAVLGQHGELHPAPLD